ncbi:uncharacterized protein LOC128992684 isoform X1 [Macrosteles quadrilineatus]|uniref:uncharacterized protein LOC128992684 isoform X1 n=1 Tax=Macrosteles quadrilineatus TaxID=74068 RepID=UPI0023E2A88F|nr:uncharacterized protein LOC128992684 isoform X1 [Macrosteles quadrilineatus]
MGDETTNEIPCNQKPCLPRVPKKPTVADDEASKTIRERPILFAGVVWIGILRRFLIPRTCTQQIHKQPEDLKPHQTSNRQVLETRHVSDSEPLHVNHKLTAVPLITEYPVVTGDPKSETLQSPIKEKSSSYVRELVAQAQESSSVVVARARNFPQELGAILRAGQRNAAEVFEALRREDNHSSRLVAISISSFVGLLCGLKKGAVPSIGYTMTGATAAASLCYPEHTKICNRAVLKVLRQSTPATSRDQCSIKGPPYPLVMGDWYYFQMPSLKDVFGYGQLQDTNDNFNATEFSRAETNVTKNISENISVLSNHPSKSSSEEIKAEPKEPSIILNRVEVEPNNEINKYPIQRDVSEQSLIEEVFLAQSDEAEDALQKIETVVNESHPHAVSDSPKLVTKHSEEGSVESENISLQSPVGVGESKEDISDAEGDHENGYTNHYEAKDESSDTVMIIKTEKLDGQPENPNETDKKSDGVPLSRKLAPYYRALPDDEKTSREKGYTDAYSNRGN